MPVNKKSLLRLKLLDQLLSDRYHLYTTRELNEKCNEYLCDNEYAPVTLRCTQKDLNKIEFEPFYAPLKRFSHAGREVVTYDEDNFSIFSKKLSDDELHLLKEVLATIGQFDGLDNFEWMRNLSDKLKLNSAPKRVISFSNNPYLQGRNLLGELFYLIAHEVVIEMNYRNFAGKEYNLIINPYLLKQYNERWYLMAVERDSDVVKNFAIDRIISIDRRYDLKFQPCAVNLEERFDDIVGVTYLDDEPLQHIVFWVAVAEAGYVDTKPIHPSQRRLKGDEDARWRNSCPCPGEGNFYEIICKLNYELIRELTSFGASLIVMAPDNIVKMVCERVALHYKQYHHE